VKIVGLLANGINFQHVVIIIRLVMFVVTNLFVKTDADLYVPIVEQDLINKNTLTMAGTINKFANHVTLNLCQNFSGGD
jgi:hypothetical protein